MLFPGLVSSPGAWNLGREWYLEKSDVIRVESSSFKAIGGHFTGVTKILQKRPLGVANMTIPWAIVMTKVLKINLYK